MPSNFLEASTLSASTDLSVCMSMNSRSITGVKESKRFESSFKRRIKRRSSRSGSHWNLFKAMAEETRQERAIRLLHEAYEHQMKKELNEAVELYRQSIDA